MTEQITYRSQITAAMLRKIPTEQQNVARIAADALLVVGGHGETSREAACRACADAIDAGLSYRTIVDLVKAAAPETKISAAVVTRSALAVKIMSSPYRKTIMDSDVPGLHYALRETDAGPWAWGYRVAWLPKSAVTVWTKALAQGNAADALAILRKALAPTAPPAAPPAGEQNNGTDNGTDNAQTPDASGDDTAPPAETHEDRQRQIIASIRVAVQGLDLAGLSEADYSALIDALRPVSRESARRRDARKAVAS